jgi:hypothetical protein
MAGGQPRLICGNGRERVQLTGYAQLQKTIVMACSDAVANPIRFSSGSDVICIAFRARSSVYHRVRLLDVKSQFELYHAFCRHPLAQPATANFKGAIMVAVTRCDLLGCNCYRGTLPLLFNSKFLIAN